MNNKMLVLFVIIAALITGSYGCGSKKSSNTSLGTVPAATGGTGTGTDSGPNGSGTGTGTTTGGGTADNIDPSHGSGGNIAPGEEGTWETSGSYYVYIPTSYSESYASPVVFLFNEKIFEWKAVADTDAVIIVDLNNYNNSQLLLNRMQHAYQKLEVEYNVDKARYYLAGWSAGGNIAIAVTNSFQNLVAAVMTFPGSGGGVEKPPERPDGAKYYYAVGDQDTSTGFYPGAVTEAEAMKALGYTAHCEVYQGCGHRIEEAVWHARAAAWEWVKGFNLKN